MIGHGFLKDKTFSADTNIKHRPRRKRPRRTTAVVDLPEAMLDDDGVDSAMEASTSTPSEEFSSELEQASCSSRKTSDFAVVDENRPDRQAQVYGSYRGGVV